MNRLPSVPADVREVLDRFAGAGYEAYCVGGCVRDALLGKEPHDWDLCTSSRPEETLALFSDHRCIETGLRHGTVTVLTDLRPLEITTYRVDGVYTDHRRPGEVRFSSSLREDCARRDFTVNAMAYSPADGVCDFFGGQEDLASGVIRCVGDPRARFEEDALRILRALRFASVLGFRIDEETSLALHEKKELLSFIARERITAEMTRLLGGNGAAEILCAFSDVCAVFLPCCTALTEPGKADALRTAFSIADTPLRRLAALLCLCGAENLSGLLRDLTYDNDSVRCVCAMADAVRLPLPEDRRGMLYMLTDISPDTARDAFVLHRALYPQNRTAAERAECLLSEVLADGVPYQASMLPIRGGDLAALGYRGAEIGACLSRLLGLIADGETDASRDALLEAARAMKAETGSGFGA